MYTRSWGSSMMTGLSLNSWAQISSQSVMLPSILWHFPSHSIHLYNNYPVFLISPQISNTSLFIFTLSWWSYFSFYWENRSNQKLISITPTKFLSFFSSVIIYSIFSLFTVDILSILLSKAKTVCMCTGSPQLQPTQDFPPASSYIINLAHLTRASSSACKLQKFFDP